MNNEVYTPQIGDVVKHYTESNPESDGQHRVVVSTNPLTWAYVNDHGVRCGSHTPNGWGHEMRFHRRATEAERRAAGIPQAPGDALTLLRSLREWVGINERARREAEVGCPSLLAKVDAHLKAHDQKAADDARPKWVRITGPPDAQNVTVGAVYKIEGRDHLGCPYIKNNGGSRWYLPMPGEVVSPSFPSWEPCDAPAGEED